MGGGWVGWLALVGATRAEIKIYQRIGVEPVINCRGTFTIISGSQSLPEVKKAMDEASRHYVHMDELMDGVGRRLAEITKAERSEEHTSELQSHLNLVCRLLLEKKK